MDADERQARQVRRAGLSQAVEQYREEYYPAYRLFAEFLEAVLKQEVRRLGMTAMVQARAKDILSFARKILRKDTKYADPVRQITDLCGARVITTSLDEIEPVGQFILRHFEIDSGNSEDALERLGTEKFGYRSVHFIVSIKAGEFEDVWQALESARCGAKEKREFRRLRGRILEHRLRAEIQVRTFLQHAWAEFSHDRVYKTDFKVPQPWARDAHRISAELEEADQAICRTIRGVDQYRTCYGVYLSRAEREEAIKDVQAILEQDRLNQLLNLELARLALSLQDWKQAEETLSPLVQEWKKSVAGRQLQASAAVLHGCWQEDTRGEIRSRKTVCEANREETAHRALRDLQDPIMAALLLAYGCACWRQGRGRGRDSMVWAIYLNQDSADAWIALGDTYIDETTSEALRHYYRALRVQPDEPRALSGLAYCTLCLERHPGFANSAQASLWAAIEHYRQWARVKVGLPRAYYDTGFFLLLLKRPYEGLAAFAKALEHTEHETALGKVLARITTVKECLQLPRPEWEWAWRFLLVAQVVQLRRMTERSRQQEIMLKAAEKKLRQLASQRQLPIKGPVILVAGGCDQSVADHMRGYRGLMDTAFAEFQGTIFSAGTVSGIGELVGELPFPAEAVTRIAYLPSHLPAWTSVHKQFLIQPSSGERFSPLEPLQTWIDLLVANVDPADVKLLGINGGDIAGFEFRSALALGAKVGVLRDSGRAATALAQDEEWVGHPNLYLLPTDPQTVKLFVQDYAPAQVLQPQDREALASRSHEDYRRGQQRGYVAQDSALVDWSELREDLKRDNRHQVDYIETILRAVGKGLRQVDPSQVKLCAFTDKQLEIMAEMEHARWNMQRLQLGWRLGPKDVKAKHSPYLVSWNQLPPETKQYDFQNIRDLPRRLQEFGYEIVDLPAGQKLAAGK